MKSGANQQSYSEAIAEFVASLTFDGIPQEVARKAKTHVIDSIGVALAGTTVDLCQRALRVAKRLGGPPESSIFAQEDKVGVASAALANGIATAALDYDDTDYWGGGAHMSRKVVATALSVGEMAHANGEEVLLAVVAGYEVNSRVGSALLVDRYGGRGAKPSWGAEDLAAHRRMQQQGQSLRSTIPGLFSSAVIASLLLKLDARQIASAQGLAGGLGLFLAQTHREGADALPLHTGWACHAGVVAALWAREDLRGPRFIYEGDRAFLSLIAGDLQDAAQLTAGLGVQWNTLNNVLKFYPGGHGTHHFIESLKTLMEQHGLSAENILEIECRAPAQRVEFHFEPREAKLHPTPYSARFSLPYLLARLVLDGNLGPLSFTQDKVSDPKVLELARRVKYAVDEEAWFGEKRGLVIVRRKDGRSFSRSTPELLGMPNRPCSRDDVLKKFRRNALLAIPDTRRLEALIETLQALEEVKDIGTVMRLAAA